MSPLLAGRPALCYRLDWHPSKRRDTSVRSFHVHAEEGQCEDNTVRRRPPASQEESPPQEPAQPAPWPCTSSLQHREMIYVYRSNYPVSGILLRPSSSDTLCVHRQFLCFKHSKCLMLEHAPEAERKQAHGRGSVAICGANKTKQETGT